MRRTFITVLLLSGALVAAESVRSGHAGMQWEAARTYQAGSELRTVVVLDVDEGWHTYWENPGAGGMEPSFRWTLPDGWRAEAPRFPVPIRFSTNGLAGFGYKGRVMIPVLLHAPADAEGAVEIGLRVSWLTCDDASCVPGRAEVALRVEPGPVEPPSELVEEAMKRIPVAEEDAVLEVIEDGESLVLKVSAGDGGFDPSGRNSFPATAQVVDPEADIRFAPVSAGASEWRAVVPKDEYFSPPLDGLRLVFSSRPGSSSPPVELTWQP